MMSQAFLRILQKPHSQNQSIKDVRSVWHSIGSRGSESVKGLANENLGLSLEVEPTLQS